MSRRPKIKNLTELPRAWASTSSPEIENEVLPYKYKITSYGADYTVDVLIKRLKDGHIVIPNLQRSYVWSIKQASRFIESLLLGLPVPGIFFAKEKETEKMLVIDGQQRLMSLKKYYEGFFSENRPFALEDVQKEFVGKTFGELSEEDKRLLGDSIIHATIIKQDIPSDDESSIFFVFERLNTGGVVLTAQEIRNGIYQGKFNDLLKAFNERKDWRFLYGPHSTRLRDEELILRFFALFFEGDKYKKPMKAFLNAFMASNRDLNKFSEKKLSDLFDSTVSAIKVQIGKKAFRLKAQTTAALIDAVLVGVASRLSKGALKKKKSLDEAFKNLLSDNEFLLAITKATSDEDTVRFRLRKAIAAFGVSE